LECLLIFRIHMTVSAVSPWRTALRREACLPTSVRGPVLLSALRDWPRTAAMTSLRPAWQIGFVSVRLVGACYQRRRIPPRELSIDLVADERLGRATGRAEAS